MHEQSAPPQLPAIEKADEEIKEFTLGTVKSELWVETHWSFREILGRGHFSEVRVEIHRYDNTLHAVKVCDKDKFRAFLAKRKSQLTMQSEVEILTSLHHSGIIKLYSCFETESYLYLVMDLLPGGDLLNSIMNTGSFTEIRAQQLFRQLVSGVKYIHSKHFVHRDLKPNNMLFSCQCRNTATLLLADFGLAKFSRTPRDCHTFCGTPAYMAPEVIQTQLTDCGYGRQSDMWSIGVTLYVLLSGEPPFDDEDLFEQICDGSYSFDGKEWKDITAEAKDISSS